MCVTGQTIAQLFKERCFFKDDFEGLNKTRYLQKVQTTRHKKDDEYRNYIPQWKQATGHFVDFFAVLSKSQTVYYESILCEVLLL